MSRERSRIPRPATFFSTRHFRVAHRDALRSYGAILRLNLDEALDRAVAWGLERMKQEAAKELEREQATTKKTSTRTKKTYVVCPRGCRCPTCDPDGYYDQEED